MTRSSLNVFSGGDIANGHTNAIDFPILKWTQVDIRHNPDEAAPVLTYG